MEANDVSHVGSEVNNIRRRLFVEAEDGILDYRGVELEGLCLYCPCRRCQDTNGQPEGYCTTEYLTHRRLLGLSENIISATAKNNVHFFIEPPLSKNWWAWGILTR